MESVKNSLRYLQLNVQANSKHDYSLRKWQRLMWYITLYTWRSAILFGLIYLIYKLAY